MKHSNVTFIGLGQMGAALVPPFIDAGRQVTVWNRNIVKAEPLVALGAVAQASFVEALKASELIIVCLSDYASSDALFLQDDIAALLKGKTLVQFTTGNARQAVAGSRWAAEIGLNYLDGAIMDYPTKIGRSDCMLLVSGPESVWRSCEAEMLLLGGRMTYVGENPGASNVLDGTLLTLYYGNAFALMQSAAMLQAEKLDIKDFATALHAFKPVIESVWARTLDAIDRQDYSGNEASIHVHSQGVQSLVDRASSAGVEHRLLSLFSSYVEHAVSTGHEGDELSAAYEAFRPR